MQLVKANTGRYKTTIPVDGGPAITEEGRYQFAPHAFEITRDQPTPEGSILRMMFRVIDGDTWIRMTSVGDDDGRYQSWRCWVDLKDVRNAPGFPSDLAATPGNGGQPPNAVITASYGLGAQIVDDNHIAGTTDLATALSLLGGKALSALGIDPLGDATVPAKFLINGSNALAGFTVDFADLSDAVEAAGGNSSPLETLGDSDGSIVVSFTALGEPVDVRPPPKGQLLSLQKGDDLSTAMAGCGA